jgi:UDP-glucose 4-epimerase
MTTLVTGGAGYVGSHILYALLDSGKNAVVIDDLSTGKRSQVSEQAHFYRGDIADHELLAGIVATHSIDTVVHCAGSIVVPDSVVNPLAYYENNVRKSLALITACVTLGVKKFVFSSSAAVYGESSGLALTEDAPANPASPYGRSKLMVEWFLEDVARAHDFRYGILRYFNVAGADPGGRSGQPNLDASHLISRAAKVALGYSEYLNIYGTDFPTADGTAMRDYIHVSDLAAAHMLVLDHLHSGGGSKLYNCGYGHGVTVRQVVEAVESVMGVPLAVREGPRRPGDAPISISDSRRIRQELGWIPRYDDLNEIVRSAIAWERHIKAEAVP